MLDNVKGRTLHSTDYVGQAMGYTEVARDNFLSDTAYIHTLTAANTQFPITNSANIKIAFPRPASKVLLYDLKHTIKQPFSN